MGVANRSEFSCLQVGAPGEQLLRIPSSARRGFKERCDNSPVLDDYSHWVVYYSSRPVSDCSAPCSACLSLVIICPVSSVLPPRYSHHLPVTSSSTCTLTCYYKEPLDLLSTSHTASLFCLLSCAHLPALGTGAQLPAFSTSYHSDLTRPPLRTPQPYWNP
uniref:Vestigial like 2a n=1 Tax=Nothobranchius rachovii TaxID=451742 RepID=A0A1A8SCM3_9TELE